MSKSACVFLYLSAVIFYCHGLEAYRNISNTNVSLLEDTSKLNIVKFEGNCNKTIRESQFLLESPNYPDKYSFNSNCEITLQGQKCPLYYKFRFIDFNVQNSIGCTKDRLEIDQLDAICGFRNGTKTYIAKNGILKLRFISDDAVSSRGYKILVTRIEECLKDAEKVPNFVTTVKRLNPAEGNLRMCCSKSLYDSKYFTLKSPNFPLSMSQANDCVYQIQKASPDICRLRIRFQFFWMGNSLDCREGFLEMNGKFICGCKKELNLLSDFSENIKILRFKSNGIVSNSYSGYVAEIFQDECPKKVESKVTKDNIQKRSATYANLQYAPFLPKRRTDVFFFTYPEDESYANEKEDTNIVEIENIDQIFGNDASNYGTCLRWNQGQFDIISAQRQEYDVCTRDKNKINENPCSLFAQKIGFFSSPGYPFFYPGNLRMCYRFPKLPGHCTLRIHFLDFRIGYSEGCFQDRVEIENVGRSCGANLWNQIIRIDLRNVDYKDLIFTTTIPKCLQGFKAIYEQIPCQEITTELPPLPPYTRIQPVIPTTDTPLENCGGMINEKKFTITYDGRNPECRFVIRNFNEDACGLNLYFDNFLLDCSTETLKINGKNYCGNQTGRKIEIENKRYPTEIIYSRLRAIREGTKFVISGMQFCEAPEPPAQLNK